MRPCNKRDKWQIGLFEWICSFESKVECIRFVKTMCEPDELVKFEYGTREYAIKASAITNQLISEVFDLKHRITPEYVPYRTYYNSDVHRVRRM